MGLVVDFPRPECNGEADEDLVAMLEDLVARARSGRLQSVVAVTADGDGTPALALRMQKGAATALIGALHVGAAKLAKLVEQDL